MHVAAIWVAGGASIWFGVKKIIDLIRHPLGTSFSKVSLTALYMLGMILLFVFGIASLIFGLFIAKLVPTI